MSVIYIREQGIYLEKRKERLIAVKNHQTLLDIPVSNIDNLVIMGNAQITMQLLQFLLQHGVDISFFSFGGRYLGHAAAESSRNIFVRLFQYDFYQTLDKRFLMAKLIVCNKIDNQLNVIEKFRWTGMDYDYKRDIRQLREQQQRLADQQTVEQIMGVEGFASKIYFGAYGKMFRCKTAFNGRNRRPPRDPVNVILSLGYTILTKEVAVALEAESFEMYLGFLHGIRYGRKSLALDIVEEFRQPVIDRLTLRLFNKGMLVEYDFETDDEEVRLTEEGFRTFIKEYEKWMTDKEYADPEMNFRSRIRAQAALLQKVLQKKEDYRPYKWGGLNKLDFCEGSTFSVLEDKD